VCGGGGGPLANRWRIGVDAGSTSRTAGEPCGSMRVRALEALCSLMGKSTTPASRFSSFQVVPSPETPAPRQPPTISSTASPPAVLDASEAECIVRVVQWYGNKDCSCAQLVLVKA